MSARALEAFLARIFVDGSARASFKANPRGEGLRAGLSEEECSGLEKIDWTALELACSSYARKRLAKGRQVNGRSKRRKWQALLKRVGRQWL
jgi:hypothetical protein